MRSSPWWCSRPLSIYLCVLVRLSSRGPVFVRQLRVGRGGRIFTLWKFRTTVWSGEPDPDPESELAPLLRNSSTEALSTVAEDVRVTRVGRFMRLAGSDELPQLVNILLGDMSFVGPRPRLPEQVTELPYESLPILLARPGLTGLSQVAGVTAGPRRDALDLHYVRSWTWTLDLVILLRAARLALASPRVLGDPFEGG